MEFPVPNNVDNVGGFRKCEGKGNRDKSRFPSGMTTRKAKAKAKTNAGVLLLRQAQGQNDRQFGLAEASLGE
jgi:hypothetical protein